MHHPNSQIQKAFNAALCLQSSFTIETGMISAANTSDILLKCLGHVRTKWWIKEQLE